MTLRMNEIEYRGGGGESWQEKIWIVQKLYTAYENSGVENQET